MIFAGLVMMVPVTWFLPWWSVPVLSFALGIYRGNRQLFAVQTAFSAGIAWAALAFVKDGHNSGLISKRVGGLFSMKESEFIFAFGFLVAFITVYLAFNAGAVLSRRRTLYR